MAHWDGAQSQAKMTKIRQNTPTCDVTSRNPPIKNKTHCFSILLFFDFGFEQLSSSGGWQVMAKRVACANVKG